MSAFSSAFSAFSDLYESIPEDLLEIPQVQPQQRNLTLDLNPTQSTTLPSASRRRSSLEASELIAARARQVIAEETVNLIAQPEHYPPCMVYADLIVQRMQAEEEVAHRENRLPGLAFSYAEEHVRRTSLYLEFFRQACPTPSQPSESKRREPAGNVRTEAAMPLWQAVDSRIVVERNQQTKAVAKTPRAMSANTTADGDHGIGQDRILHRFMEHFRIDTRKCTRPEVAHRRTQLRQLSQGKSKMPPVAKCIENESNGFDLARLGRIAFDGSMVQTPRKATVRADANATSEGFLSHRSRSRSGSASEDEVAAFSTTHGSATRSRAITGWDSKGATYSSGFQLPAVPRPPGSASGLQTLS